MNQKYPLIKNLREPLALFRGVYLFDLIFVAAYIGIAMMLAQFFVAEPLKYVYILVSAIFSIMLTRFQKENPGRRLYQCIYIYYRKTSETIYELANDTKQKEIEDFKNEIYEENHSEF